MWSSEFKFIKIKRQKITNRYQKLFFSGALKITSAKNHANTIKV